jgi:LysR family glycine cleavage system transcriptional activator
MVETADGFWHNSAKVVTCPICVASPPRSLRSPTDTGLLFVSGSNLMHKLREFVPSANFLFTFEAAARRGSFTAAASELNVSQPAVSKAIRQLEDGLGFKLFRRNHYHLELTAEGKRLFQEVEKSFDHLHDIVSSMRRTSCEHRVKASFSASFLQLWLLPRLSDFYDLHPNITLSLEESAYDDFDLFANEIDVSARLGNGDWTDVQSWKLVPELIFPVAHPGYIAANGGEIGLDQIPDHRLLHFAEKNRLRYGWKDWLFTHGVSMTTSNHSVTFSDALSSLGAAALGHGIALGWTHLVLDYVLRGALQPVGNAKFSSGNDIFLVASRKRPLSAGGKAFVDWLLKRMGEDMARHPSLFDTSTKELPSLPMRS